MRIKLDQLFIIEKLPPKSLRHFVEFWSARYSYADEFIYTENIGRPRTRERLLNLFNWKIGNRFFESKRQLLNDCFLNRLDEGKVLLRTNSTRDPREFAARFLNHFQTGGAIWRIFWLHCWNDRFPIYDQHVHRAMKFVGNDAKFKELDKHADSAKIKFYLNDYLPFFDQFDGIEPRKVDRALWQFGKSIKPNRGNRLIAAASP